MHSFAPIRFTVVASLALAASLLAQSPNTPQAKPAVSPQLPSTLPPTPLTAPSPPPQPLTPSQLPPKRAQVTYADGTLSISADNASLNQILRQISSDTGIKITGGVSDERVFGEYGPAPPDQVLSALLDGTGSNMVLVHSDGTAPAELILTPRQGGPTPPNPNAAAFNDRSEPQEIPHNQAVQPGQSVPEIPNPNNQVNPVANPGASTETPPANSSQPQSPNGVKTPQQIYEELQRMRQQQQQPKPQ
jgi:hypothetical protein